MLPKAHFETVKSLLLTLSAAQKKEVLLILGAKATVVIPDIKTAGQRLYSTLVDVCRSRARIELPIYQRMSRATPQLIKRVNETGDLLEKDIQAIFPKLQQLQFVAVRFHFVNMACTRIEELEVPITISRILDCLVPLSELLDAQLPGYRQNNVLTKILLQHVTGEPICLEAIQ